MNGKLLLVGFVGKKWLESYLTQSWLEMTHSIYGQRCYFKVPKILGAWTEVRPWNNKNESFILRSSQFRDGTKENRSGICSSTPLGLSKKSVPPTLKGLFFTSHCFSKVSVSWKVMYPKFCHRFWSRFFKSFPLFVVVLRKEAAIAAKWKNFQYILTYGK